MITVEAKLEAALLEAATAAPVSIVAWVVSPKLKLIATELFLRMPSLGCDFGNDRATHPGQ